MASTSIRRKICLLLFIISIVLICYYTFLLQHRYAKHPIASCGHVFDYNWSVLLVVNEGFYDIFSNWMWHYQRLGINVPIIVMTEDDVVYARLRARFPSNCKHSVYVDRSTHDSSTEALTYGTDGYKRLVSATPMSILKYLQEGINVFYSDIDTVWLKNPFPYFNGSYDMWIEQVYAGKRYCAGFMAMKSNNKTIKLMKDWKTGLNISLQTNNPLFNHLLKQSEVKFKPLNENLFPPGTTFNKMNVHSRSKVVVFHNTFVFGYNAKLERFKKFNLWFQTL